MISPLSLVRAMSADSPPNFVIIGAGLWGRSLALAIRRHRPDLQILILDASEPVPHRTWSFHLSDLNSNLATVPGKNTDSQTNSQTNWFLDYVSAQWPSQTVHFPSHSRTLNSGYATIRSEDFMEKSDRELGAWIHRDFVTKVLAPDGAHGNGEAGVEVHCASGAIYRAPLVIDTRPQPLKSHELGYQKFLGLDVELQTDHKLDSPIIMDATVEQIDGYRFMYVLPFSPRTLLIEDTIYSNTPDLDPAVLEQRILQYCSDNGLKIRRVLRREQGVLPVPLSSRGFQNPLHPWHIGPGTGMAHATTSYSVPALMQTIRALLDFLNACQHSHTSSTAKLTSTEMMAAWTNTTQNLREQFIRQNRFFFMLNKMLFRAAAPQERRKILERFYTLSPQLISRFYAMRTTPADCARILMGRPPVPIWRAIQSLVFRRSINHEQQT